MNANDERCYASANKYCACIEFRPDENLWYGFGTSQLIAYILEPNPDAGDSKDAPPQRLSLAFSTADVVILGWRLGRLAGCLRESSLAVVTACANSKGTIDSQNVFVAAIKITPIEKK